jgi:hypothetical protein
MAVTVQSITYTGIDSGAYIGRRTGADQSSFNLTGVSNQLKSARKSICSVGSYLLSGISIEYVTVLSPSTISVNDISAYAVSSSHAKINKPSTIVYSNVTNVVDSDAVTVVAGDAKTGSIVQNANLVNSVDTEQQSNIILCVHAAAANISTEVSDTITVNSTNVEVNNVV